MILNAHDYSNTQSLNCDNVDLPLYDTITDAADALSPAGFAHFSIHLSASEKLALKGMQVTQDNSSYPFLTKPEEVRPVIINFINEHITWTNPSCTWCPLLTADVATRFVEQVFRTASPDHMVSFTIRGQIENKYHSPHIDHTFSCPDPRLTDVGFIMPLRGSSTAFYGSHANAIANLTEGKTVDVALDKFVQCKSADGAYGIATAFSTQSQGIIHTAPIHDTSRVIMLAFSFPNVVLSSMQDHRSSIDAVSRCNEAYHESTLLANSIQRETLKTHAFHVCTETLTLLKTFPSCSLPDTATSGNTLIGVCGLHMTEEVNNIILQLS